MDNTKRDPWTEFEEKLLAARAEARKQRATGSLEAPSMETTPAAVLFRPYRRKWPSVSLYRQVGYLPSLRSILHFGSSPSHMECPGRSQRPRGLLDRRGASDADGATDRDHWRDHVPSYAAPTRICLWRKCERPLDLSGTPGRTRTCDPRLRRPLLYPTELQALV